MSYLTHCDRVRQSSDKFWRVQWRSVRGTIEMHGDYPGPSAYWIAYSRYTKLGELLGRNAECERKFIADAIEARCGIRPTAWVGV